MRRCHHLKWLGAENAEAPPLPADGKIQITENDTHELRMEEK